MNREDRSRAAELVAVSDLVGVVEAHLDALEPSAARSLLAAMHCRLEWFGETQWGSGWQEQVPQAAELDRVTAPTFHLRDADGQALCLSEWLDDEDAELLCQTCAEASVAVERFRQEAS